MCSKQVEDRENNLLSIAVMRKCGCREIERFGHSRQDREWRISTPADFYWDLNMVVGHRIGSTFQKAARSLV